VTKFAVQVVSANDRPEVYVEIEFGGELVAEAYVQDGEMRLSFPPAVEWSAPATEFEDAIARAREALNEFGLFESAAHY
jgi:hypothetical protein